MSEGKGKKSHAEEEEEEYITTTTTAAVENLGEMESPRAWCTR